MALVRLGDVAIEARDTCKDDKSGYKIVGLEHLTPGEITLTNWDENVENTFSKLFKQNDILFGRRRAYLKKAAIAPFDGICSGDITVIRAKDDKITPELLPFIIQNDDFFDYAVGKSAGSLSPRVKWEHLQKYEFELPSLEEQKKLAKVLWAINDTKQAYQDLLKKTDELIKSQFIEMFGDTISMEQKYNTVSLLSIFDNPAGGEWGDDDSNGTGTPVLRTTNFTDEGIVDYSDVATRIIDIKKLEKKSLQYGDILIEKSGGSNEKPVGRVVHFLGESDKYLNNNFTARLHLISKEFDNTFVFFFMYVNYWQGGTKLYEGKTTGIHNIHLTDYLEKTFIPVAPIELQKKFVNLFCNSKIGKNNILDAIYDLDSLTKKIISENLQNK